MQYKGRQRRDFTLSVFASVNWFRLFFFFKYEENGQDSHLSDDITEPHISSQNIAFPHPCYKLKASRHHLNKL